MAPFLGDLKQIEKKTSEFKPHLEPKLQSSLHANKYLEDMNYNKMSLEHGLF